MPASGKTAWLDLAPNLTNMEEAQNEQALLRDLIAKDVATDAPLAHFGLAEVWESAAAAWKLD